MRALIVGAGAALAVLGGCAGVAAAADFDARRPADVLGVVTTHGASGELKSGKQAKPYIDARAGKVFFNVDFYDCDNAKTLCATDNFYAYWSAKDVKVDQINRWNRWTLWCPAYLDKDGEPNIWMSTGVMKTESREEMATMVDTWMDCLRDFDAFVANPEDVLRRKEAPPKTAGSPT